MRTRSVLAALLIAVAGSPHSILAQTHTMDSDKSEILLKREAAIGLKLTANTVSGSIGVTAVLLRQASVKRLFGAAIEKAYAVVQLTISNKNPDAAFVLHSAYIDTSQWALGGGSQGFGPVSASNPDDPNEMARSGGSPNRIASVESRIARGELLDAQQWTGRNWTVRLLTLAGSLASGYSFAFKEAGIGKAIASFNGNLVPGVAVAWPDSTVAQQNRISDFGYQTNKVIGKENSDVIVCFFPIDMFLTPSWKDTFLKTPALLLSPFQLLGKPYETKLADLGLKDAQILAMRDLLPCYSKIFEPKIKESKANRENFPLLLEANDAIVKGCREEIKDPKNKDALEKLNYIGRLGIQNIGIYVDGIMTVNIDVVPASIDQISFDGDPTKTDFWAKAGEKKGSVECRFCEGGVISLLEADKLGITKVTTEAGADDKHLSFSFTTSKAIDVGTLLHFVITKKSADPKKSPQEVKSPAFSYVVGYTIAAPTITSVSVTDGKVAVAGSGFFNLPNNALTALLQADGNKDKDIPVKLADGQPSDQLSFDVPSDLPPGCWNVRVKVNQMPAAAPNTAASKILSSAKPTLTAATRSGDHIAVTGTQLVDTSACGGAAITFQLMKGEKGVPVSAASTLQSATTARVALPPAVKTGKWTLQLLQGATPGASIEVK